MYNRYIRDSSGSYTRVPQNDDLSSFRKNESSCEGTASPNSTSTDQKIIPPVKDPGFLRHTLDQLHLEHIDSGDLLLLGLLFFLFREGADEELLAALGLLLIL